MKQFWTLHGRGLLVLFRHVRFRLGQTAVEFHQNDDGNTNEMQHQPVAVTLMPKGKGNEPSAAWKKKRAHGNWTPSVTEVATKVPGFCAFDLNCLEVARKTCAC